MSATANRIGISEPVTQHRADHSNLTRDLQTLLVEYKIASCIRLRMTTSESIEIVEGSFELDTIFRDRSKDLAEVAIRTGQSQSCVFASPEPAILIAEPIPATDGECIYVRFHCELDELKKEEVVKRLAVVAKTASCLVAMPTSPSLNAQVEQSASLPSWIELAGLLKRKLVAAITQTRPKIKIYLSTILACVCVCMVPWPHSISCKVVCEPVFRRYVAAPFDARLLRAHVLVGQRVRQGDLLATLDGGELRSQLASIRAKLAQAEQRELAALSTGDHSKSGMERLEVEHLRREAELLERRQANLEIRSPINGIVVTGDLERAEGAPLAVGDNLFEIASLEQLIAEIAVPEADVLFVKDAMSVSIVLDAIPGSQLETKIQRIHLRSEIRNNESVFIAEAELPNYDALLRPGMNAKATINAGCRAIGWQLFRRPYIAARQWIGW